MDKTTVHGLLVFFDFGLETTISSNMVPTSSRLAPSALRRHHHFGGCFRLRVRFLPSPADPSNDATRPPAEQQCQNWSTFLPQSPPPGQRRKREAPGRPSGKARPQGGRSDRG